MPVSTWISQAFSGAVGFIRGKPSGRGNDSLLPLELVIQIVADHLDAMLRDEPKQYCAEVLRIAQVSSALLNETHRIVVEHQQFVESMLRLSRTNFEVHSDHCRLTTLLNHFALVSCQSFPSQECRDKGVEIIFWCERSDVIFETHYALKRISMAVLQSRHPDEAGVQDAERSRELPDASNDDTSKVS
ncbi:MAG: hypothetical protein Q9162_003717 [Coniocarpon cinnabarinum]